MELFTGTISLESLGRAADQALVARTTALAWTRAPALSSCAGWPGTIWLTPQRSWISTPRASATRRMPCTSKAGCTVALLRSKTPARCTGEPVRRATSLASRRSKGLTPSRSQAARVSFQASRWCAVVAVHSQPFCWKCASMSCRAQNSPSSWIARSALSPRKRACASLQKPSKVPIFGHQDITKPPFLPEAPPPQTSCSSSRTRASGSSCLRVMAVQSPTKPPPTIATSAEWVPTRGALAASARSVERIQWLGVRGGVSVSFMARVRGR